MMARKAGARWSIDSRDIRTMVHCLRVAAETFTEHAATLDALADAGGNPMITAVAARRLADEYRRQTTDAGRVRSLLEDSTDVDVTGFYEE